MARGSVPIFLVGSLVLAALLFVGLRPLFLATFAPGAVGSLFYGLAASLLVVTGSYFLLRRGIGATDRSFLAVFVGGILGRLFLFAAMVAIAFAVKGLNGRAATVAILAAFLPLTALEIWCVLREANRKRGGPARAAGAGNVSEREDG